MNIEETPIIAGALRNVAALLPASWSMNSRTRPRADDGPADGEIDLMGPRGDGITFVLVAKQSGSIPTVYLLGTLRELKRRCAAPLLFVSDYIGPSLRTALANEGISFADATGWVRVVSEDPLILLTGRGAEVSPTRRSTGAVVRMNGVAVSRLIRRLSTVDLPIGVRDLAERAGASPGSASKLLATLAAEGVVDRDDRGGVVMVRRRALIHRWARDYAFAKANSAVRYCIAPRGLERALARLGDGDRPVAITGSAAARRLLPENVTSVVPLRLLSVYTADPDALAQELGLIEADRQTANVVLASPQDAAILASAKGMLPLAPVALVLADLLTLPNRSDAEADQLMDALARADQSWRE